MKHSKENVVSNMLWRFADKWLEQLVGLAVSLILARLLIPEAYGVVSLITIFTAILRVFVDSGFSQALIQKKDADQLDLSTVFWFNCSVGLFLYLVMFLCAPFIARFFNQEGIVPHIRVMSLSLVFGGLNGVQHVLVAKKMIFKKFFFASLIGTVVSAVVGIVLAYMGCGAWALIALNLTNQVIDGAFLWWTVRWMPSFQFSFKRLRPLFKFGGKLLGSSLLATASEKLSSLLIGRFYTSADLAYYDKGSRIPTHVVKNLENSVQSVLFPVMADAQDDLPRVKQMLKKSIMVSAYCIFPLMVGLGVCAEPLVLFLYTEKWAALIPYLQLYSFMFSLYLLHTANLQVLRALGRSDIFLKLDIIKQIIGFAAMAASLPFGVLPMLAAGAVVNVISYFLNSHPNKKLIDYGSLEQLKDLLPIIILNVIMGVGVYFAGLIPVGIFPKLVIQAVSGVTIYLLGSRILKIDIARYLIATVRGMLHKH